MRASGLAAKEIVSRSRAPCRTNRPASESSRLTDAGEVDDLVEPLGASFGLRPRASHLVGTLPFQVFGAAMTSGAIMNVSSTAAERESPDRGLRSGEGRDR